jgi:hypothetical protein
LSKAGEFLPLAGKADAGGRGSVLVGGGTLVLRSGRLFTGCRVGAGVGTGIAFLARGRNSSGQEPLDICSDMVAGASEAVFFAGSGVEAGDTGETNVLTSSAFLSSFWYSGVGGRLTDGAV